MGVNNIEKIVSPLVKNGLKSVLLFGVVTKLQKVHHFTIPSECHKP